MTPLGAETSLDIGSGNLTCNDANTLYRITGSSESNHITVSGGSAQQPIQVDLNGVNINLHKDNDGDSKEASPLTVKSGSYAMIYIGKDNAGAVNYLYGGNEHGAGKNWGYAGLCVENGAHVTIAGQGALTAHGGGVEYGGAGIGGNYDEDMSDLVIDGTMTINATGAYSAPGIGAGRDGTLYNLTIKKGNITAQGGKFAPGIGAGDAVGTGSGGETHGIVISGGTAGWGTSKTIVEYYGGDMGDITISNSQVTANGGEGGAGIGSGMGGRISDSIQITDSEVAATGGYHAAGIGGGANGWGGRGADLDGFYSRGKSKITANGGEGSAGIGGGIDGAASRLNFDLTTTPNLDYYVKATGGGGAAGIGSGGVVITGQEVFTPQGHTADTVTITGGHIVARGGGNAGSHGSGAGIGGGARKGVLQNLMISGGYVEAYSGNGDACDIGRGGKGGVDPLISDKDFTIIGGTVIADEWSDETTPQISGGSVSANLKNVKNGSGTRVYRTTLTLAREANALVEKLTTLDSGYGTRDIFSDQNKKISLYLPQSEEKAAWADITLTGEKRHYYGTTTTDGNGVLKMDGTGSKIRMTQSTGHCKGNTTAILR